MTRALRGAGGLATGSFLVFHTQSVEEKGSLTMSLEQNTERWKKKLKLDAHYTMERFGIATAAFALTLTLIGGGTVATAITNNIEQTAQTALYTPRFSTSKTDLSGQVDGVYVSQDRPRWLVLMNFAPNISHSLSPHSRN